MLEKNETFTTNLQPRPGDAEFGCFGQDETEVDLAEFFCK